MELAPGVTLTSNTGAVDVPAAVTLPGAGLRTLDIATSSTLGGVVSGDGTLVKRGAGVLHAIATSTNTGGISVAEGDLDVPAAATGPGSVTLGGGRLVGSGTVGAVSGVAGSIDPDGSTTLTTGALALTGPAEFHARVTGTASNRVATTSTSLTNTELDLEVVGTPAPIGTVLTLVDTAGVAPVVGTFAGHAQGASFLLDGVQWQVSYVGGSGNDVTLTRVARPVAVTIAQGTTTSALGNPVTLTATATVVGDPVAATATFTDGGTPIGTATVSAGAATFTTTTLEVGVHELGVSIAAADDTSTATSATVTHEVTPSTETVPPTDAPPVTPTNPTPVVTTPLAPTPVPVVEPEAALRPVTRVFVTGSCLRASTGDLRIAYTLAQRARVTYTLQRRLSPPLPTIAQCPTELGVGVGATAGATAPKPRFRALRTLQRTEAKGRRTVTIAQLTRQARLEPGVYRLMIDVRSTKGKRLQRFTRTFIVLAS